MKLFVYIHGFGTTGYNSEKYKHILFFCNTHNIDCVALEWKANEEHIVEKLKLQLEENIQGHRELYFIASSTGCNFAYQLISSLNTNNYKIAMLFINPFVSIEQTKIYDERFPVSLANQMQLPCKNLKNIHLILAKEDEVLNSDKTLDYFPENILVDWIEPGNHSLNKELENRWSNLLSAYIK